MIAYLFSLLVAIQAVQTVPQAVEGPVIDRVAEWIGEMRETRAQMVRLGERVGPLARLIDRLQTLVNRLIYLVLSLGLLILLVLGGWGAAKAYAYRKISGV